MQRKTPRELAVERARDFGQAVMQIALRDPLATVLLGFGDPAHDPVLQPAGLDRARVRRAARSRSARSSSWPQEDQIESATLLDAGRARRGRRPRAARRCGRPTRPRTRRPTTSCARCAAAARSSRSSSRRGRPSARIVVQFLMPILILVCLFAFFMRIGQDGGAGGFAAFSKLGNRGKKRKKGAHPVTFADVAGANESVAELREIRDYLADPSRYATHGRDGAPRRAAGRAPGNRQDAARPRRRRARRRRRSSRSRARSSWSRWWAWARHAFATCSSAPARWRRRSCSSTSWTPPAADAAPASGRATTSASRPSTSCSSRWTASTRERDRRDGAPPTAPTSSTPRCCGRAASTAR